MISSRRVCRVTEEPCGAPISKKCVNKGNGARLSSSRVLRALTSKKRRSIPSNLLHSGSFLWLSAIPRPRSDASFVQSTVADRLRYAQATTISPEQPRMSVGYPPPATIHPISFHNRSQVEHPRSATINAQRVCTMQRRDLLLATASMGPSFETAGHLVNASQPMHH